MVRAGWAAGGGVAFALAFSCSDPLSTHDDDNQFRDDIMACEEAQARLQKCCPDKPARLRCEYVKYTGCNGEQIENFPDDAQAVLDSSCSFILTHDYCRVPPVQPR